MGASILVVDDSRLDRRLTEECLRRCGYGVTTASDGYEALERLELHPVDLVVTDLTMPGIDGFELLQRIKQRSQPLPVILVTSSGSEGVVTRALRAGADDYVSKAHLPDQLPAATERLLEIAHESRKRRQAEEWITRQQVSYQLTNDRQQVTGIVRRLCEYGLSMGCLGPQDEIRVSVALEEALLNAIIHGNLEVSSKLREEEGDEFEQLIALRRADDYYARRRVRVDCDITREEARFRIADEGPGFDVRKLPDPRDPERMLLASGRGVLMMRAFMDEVDYNDRGNVVTLVKRRRDELSSAHRNGGDVHRLACASA
jgi:CheY-like chemotaxis protein/anti-sigma regulatory factor (Ser/Thr protein kinase)